VGNSVQRYAICSAPNLFFGRTKAPYPSSFSHITWFKKAVRSIGVRKHQRLTL